MKYFFTLILPFLSLQFGYTQNSQLWKGYFSYKEIKDISQSPTSFFAAAENALFSKNLTTNTLKTTNTIDGLSGQTITAMYHSDVFNKTIIGYENGLITIVNEADGSMLNVVDIITNGVNQNLKKVNHFMENDGIIYVSCDFGIVQYNLATSGFGDTYRIGNSGTEINISQTAAFNGFIYAATADGIRRATLANPNLNDYNQWTQVISGGFSGIETFGTELIATANWGQVFKYNGSGFFSFTSLPLVAKDLRANGNYLLVTTESMIYVYNQNLSLLLQINSNQIPDITAKFTCATIINSLFYIGTLEDGIITTTIANPTTFTFLSPDGPSRNALFAINASTKSLWAVYGGYSSYYNPYTYDFNGLNTYGFSKYSENGWLNTPYSAVLGAKSLCKITVNPSNTNQVYISSFFSGLLKVENDIPVVLYDESNSTLESLVLNPPNPNYKDIRINGAAFDKSGNLWVGNGWSKNGIKKLTPQGAWSSVNIEPISQRYYEDSYGEVVVDKNGTKWMASSYDGVIGYNEVGNVFKKISLGADLGNLPVVDARVVAIDNRNQLWIGTISGLRVLSSVDRFLTDAQLSSNSIIILENGLAQELLYEQFITDIVVDGANNKWVGTADSGVFQFSSDGQETLHRFTSSNSPLPSNGINDIDINPTTGEVFFATDKGMVSFKGTATTASSDLSNVNVYPNPVRPEFEGTVKISGLLNKCTVKITDIEGNLVYEEISEGGTIEWDTKAFGKYKVASGVYMIFISAQDGLETKVKKVMIIR
jgi:ligand-binding sensor domain-containing protein